MQDIESKHRQLRDILSEMGSVVIGYSGGVDSSFLAAVAHEVLGQRALAVTALSPTYTDWELSDATELAQRLGMRHLVIETRQMEDPSFVANPSNRCYYCKRELYLHLRRIAAEERMQWVANGTNLDDLGDFRPGLEAGREFGVRSPLVEAGLTKAEVRLLSRERGLPTWDKPAMACLASRIPYGTPVTLDNLDRVGKGEQFLRSLGIRQVRVRHHNNLARIEVDAAGIELLMTPETRARVLEHFRSLGYTFVALDLAGYRTGSLNEVLGKARTQ